MIPTTDAASGRGGLLLRLSRRTVLGALGLLLVLATRLASAAPGGPFISEILAINDGGLADEDGDHPDWIELFNPTGAPVNLAGWHLTDDAADPTKWTFPTVIVPTNGFLVVFASDKNRAMAGAELHTNFKLTSGGEYLGLVEPDGTTVASEFAPAYPPQFPNVAFGPPTSATTTPLIAAGAAARALVPGDGTLGNSWTAPSFDDSAWTSGTTGAGYRLNDLLGRWEFEDDALDAESGGVDGTLNGATFSSDVPPALGGSMKSLAFDGDDSVDYPTTDFGDSFTISAWVKPDAHDDILAIVTNAAGGNTPSGFKLFINSYQTGDGRLILETGNDNIGVQTLSPFGSIATGMWQHVAVVVDRAAARARVYVDGVDVTTTPSVAPGFKVSDAWRVGRFADGGFPYRGLIDELTIWRQRLTPDQIAALAAGTAPGAVADLGALVGLPLEGPMAGVNASMFLRVPFSVADPTTFGSLQFRLRYDDGFAAYLNGAEVARRFSPPAPVWDSAATLDRPFAEALEEEAIALAPEAVVAGANVLALHGLNDAADSSEFLLLPELDGLGDFDFGGTPTYLPVPSPGAINLLPASAQGPLLTDAMHTPGVPGDSDDLVVSIRVTETTAPIAAVSLAYRTMYGAATTIAMSAQAGGVYAATIPASAAAPGEMLRWAVTATDTASHASRWPLFPDPLKSPEFEGTMVADPSIATALPVLHWFVETPAAALQIDVGTRASVFYDGTFYDNIFVRPRGASSLMEYGDKQSFKFDFNPGYRFVSLPGREPADEANLISTFSDKSYLRQILAFEAFRDSGGEYSESFPMRLEQNGAFYSVAIFTEQVDDTYLERQGLDSRGALYKAVDLNPFDNAFYGFEKKSRLDEDRSDLQALIAGVSTGNPSRASYLFDHVNLPSIVNYLAVMEIVRNRDHVEKNYYVYRDTESSGEWRFLPWDLDLTFGREWSVSCFCILNDTINSAESNTLEPLYGAFQYNGFANHLLDAVLSTPRTRAMYLRRLRTLMDLLLQESSTPVAERYFEARIAELEAAMAPDVGLDRGAWGNPYGDDQDFATGVDIILNQFLPARRTHLFTTMNTHQGGWVPDAEPAGLAVEFGDFDYNPASGDQSEEYLQLVNPNSVAVDISGWELREGVTFTFAAGTVIPAGESLYVANRRAAFRARATSPTGGEGRFVVGGYAGNLANEGETVALVDDSGGEIARLTYPARVSQWFLY